MPDLQEFHGYEAVVVGAGAAGIAVVGNLLEKNISPICWVDEEFNGGRLSKYYREVPGNLKVKYLLSWATALRPFREILTEGCSADNDPLRALRQLDLETEFPLSTAADLFHTMTRRLREFPGVVTHRGVVSKAVITTEVHRYIVQVVPSGFTHDVALVQAKRLILCTGSHPNVVPLQPAHQQIHLLPLDLALSPLKLSRLLSGRSGPTTVAVIGGSHSAVLVLRNLANLALSGRAELNIRWLTRHRLKYAEYEAGAYIAYDNTGLKGEAATWARSNLEPDTSHQSLVGNLITRIVYDKHTEGQTYAHHLPGADFMIQAIGYKQNPLPVIRTASTGKQIMPEFDHMTGAFLCSEDIGTKIPGLYGAGIAFPARVVDPKYGHTEMSIGFPAFMRAIKMWIDAWD